MLMPTAFAPLSISQKNINGGRGNGNNAVRGLISRDIANIRRRSSITYKSGYRYQKSSEFLMIHDFYHYFSSTFNQKIKANMFLYKDHVD